MDRYELKNETLTLTVDAHGAEMRSLKRNADAKEYLWQADPAFWGRTSPVLFPFVGGTKEKTYYYNGVKYAAAQHGFARDMDFKLDCQTPDEIWFSMEDTEETRKNYPFSFLLSLGYRLTQNCVTVLWKVKNTGDAPMHFSIGGHPAFNCDLTCWGLVYSKDGIPLAAPPVSGILELNGSNSLSKRTKTVPLTDGYSSLSPEMFDEDALIIEDRQADAVTLVDGERKPVLTVSFFAPLFGVWSPTGKNAPFVCIEPWYGRCDAADFSQKLEEKAYSTMLMPQETFCAQYDITVH